VLKPQQLKPDPVSAYLLQKLEQRNLQGNRRKLFLPGTGIDFCSNDYLGIATSQVLATGQQDVAYGSTGSRLLSGNSEAAMTLEAFLAAYHGQEAALLFNSGYDANLGLFAAVINRHTTVLYDEYCHASILDGIRLSPAKKAFRFRHNNLADLERKLAQYAGEGPLIIALESVYSMEGSIAPIEAVSVLAEQYDAVLIVDEAHATGVFGQRGEGLVQQLGLQDKVLARVHTFGKAMGCHGAVVVGGQVLKDYLVNFARSFIYTTALPDQALDTIFRAYTWMRDTPGTIAGLQELISYFGRQAALQIIKGWKPSVTPIQSLITGNNERTRALTAWLDQKGIQVSAVLSPTVPEGTERIRICLHAFNTEDEIDTLLHTISLCPDLKK
jgi:8-amino-7-oxononanoate synthase